MADENIATEGSGSTLPSDHLLRGLIESLIKDLKEGAGDREGRGQIEGWLRALSEKYPSYHIETGLREYYIAEAGRLRAEFDSTTSLAEKLNLGRLLESFLEKAYDIEKDSERGEE